MDVTVISPLQTTLVSKSASTTGHALGIGTSRKIAAHYAACGAVRVSFEPLAVEALGDWDRHACDILKRIASSLPRPQGSPYPATYLMQQLSLTLQKCNATLIFRRAPNPSPVIDGLC